MERILEFLLKGKGSTLSIIVAIGVSTWTISNRVTRYTLTTEARFITIESQLPRVARNRWSSVHMEFYNNELRRLKGEPVPDVGKIMDQVGNNF